MVVARKGRVAWRVTVTGRGAHAGGKHSHGANAIVQLGRTIQQIAVMTNYSQELTVNVGTVSGGTVLNRVPHEAVAEGSFALSIRKYSNMEKRPARPGRARRSTQPDGRYPCQVKVEILDENRPVGAQGRRLTSCSRSGSELEMN